MATSWTQKDLEGVGASAFGRNLFLFHSLFGCWCWEASGVSWRPQAQGLAFPQQEFSGQEIVWMEGFQSITGLLIY